MAKRIVIAFEPRELLPIYAVEMIEGDYFDARAWLEYMRKKSGKRNLELCQTDDLRLWKPKKVIKPLEFEDHFEQEKHE